jgi:5,10-methenyltetrahydrofolate synthetase
LRRERIAARSALSDEERRPASARIEAHLAALLAQRPGGTLAFCWPIRGEVDCRPLAEKLLARGWRLCQPVAVEAHRPLAFRLWTPESPMARDHHGIPVPARGESVAPDVVLVPLVAFDDRCYRLGYGGGYFDRTLATLAPRPLAIGVGFEVARTASVHPQPHDVPMDMVVTESGVFRPLIAVAFPGEGGDHDRRKELPNG